MGTIKVTGIIIMFIAMIIIMLDLILMRQDDIVDRPQGYISNAILR